MPYYGGDPMQTSASFLMQRLMRGGMSRAQAAAVVGNLRQESSLISNNMNTGEQAYGLMQWRGDRFANLQAFAAQQGKPWTDPGVQADFISHEMNTTEKGNSAEFRGATDLQSANRALADVIRYKNRDEIPLRGAYAQQAYESIPASEATTATTANDRSAAPQQVSREMSAYADPYDRSWRPSPRGQGLRYGIGGGFGALGAALVQKYQQQARPTPSGPAPSIPPDQRPAVSELGQAPAQ